MTLTNRAYLKWETSSQKIIAKGIIGKPFVIFECYKSLKIILGSKKITIPVVYPGIYDKYDVLLGNDFLQLFQSYRQTLHNVTFHTICGHFIRIPREYKPFRVRIAKSGDAILKNFQPWNDLYENIDLSKIKSSEKFSALE